MTPRVTARGTARDRALGAFYGLAVGDALGMPTQALPRATVTRLFGTLDGFRPGPVENELSAGLAVGHVTDDTDQAVIVARCLVDGAGRVDPDLLARRLLDWQAQMERTGSADLLGPSTLRALHLVAGGAPAGTTGRWGDTDGAAMRVTPLGIACPPEPLGRLCAAVADLDRLTHDTTVANAGACAVAAVVSAGVSGASWAEAGGARRGGRRGRLGLRVPRRRRRRRPPHRLGRRPRPRRRRRTAARPGRRAGRHRDRHPGGRARGLRRGLARARRPVAGRRCWLPGSAATATRSRPWPPRWSAPAPASAPCRRTR